MASSKRLINYQYTRGATAIDAVKLKLKSSREMIITFIKHIVCKSWEVWLESIELNQSQIELDLMKNRVTYTERRNQNVFMQNK